MKKQEKNETCHEVTAVDANERLSHMKWIKWNHDITHKIYKKRRQQQKIQKINKLRHQP